MNTKKFIINSLIIQIILTVFIAGLNGSIAQITATNTYGSVNTEKMLSNWQNTEKTDTSFLDRIQGALEIGNFIKKGITIMLSLVWDYITLSYQLATIPYIGGYLAIFTALWQIITAFIAISYWLGRG